MHIFVDDARQVLHELWDRLFFSDDDILMFSPAHSDVYTDALLSAHEMEIRRLERLAEERAPILALVARYRELMDDKEQLAISSNDASRLMARGGKGDRDPTRLLREEKMRKRVAKELPRVEVDLKKALEQWEDEFGEPLLVKGENLLETELRDAPAAMAPPPRAKTPGPGVSRGRANTTSSMSSHSASSAQRAKSRPNIKESTQIKPPVRSKTPTARPKTPGATGPSNQQNYVYSGASTVGRSGGRSLASVIDRSTAGTPSLSLGITPSLGPRLRNAANTSPTRGARTPLQAFHTGGGSALERKAEGGTIGRNSSIKRKLGPSAASVFGAGGKLQTQQEESQHQTQTQAKTTTISAYLRHQMEQARADEPASEARLSQGGASIRSVSPYGSDSYRSYTSPTDDASSLASSSVRATPRASTYRPSIKNLMEYDGGGGGGERQFSSSSTMSTISSVSTPGGGGSENWETYGDDDDSDGGAAPAPEPYYRPKARSVYGGSTGGAREEWMGEGGGY